MIDSEVAHIIDAIATQLGVAAERIFGMFVGAQPVIGVINLASLVTAIVVAYLVWKVSRRAIIVYLTDDDSELSSDDEFMAIFLPALAMAISFLMILIVFEDNIEPSILRITCPEYSAMKEIISLMKP